MNPKTMRAISVILPAVLLMASLPACNVAGLRRNRDAPVGPVASATDPNVTDASIDIAVVDAQEADLVEALIKHRTLYHRALDKLRAYYADRGYATKQHWAEFEQKGLGNVLTFRYLMDAEIPSARLSASESIEEADAFYRQALDLMTRGGHGVPALYDQDLMIQAAKTFKTLVERYPTSDKIDDAAFYCGEIHKEYLPGQETIAVKWYERAWMWNPQTPHPARFEAAAVYDYRLHNRDRALELYHSVLERETDHKSNVRFASRRIRELTTSDETADATIR
ncbi:MAG: hypothetical protein JSU63_06490 [Phycisphaerales bacterium]|nr:MAG: hypothetical protein JSU63_06490 [Phycisphaerales bacterium]